MTFFSFGLSSPEGYAQIENTKMNEKTRLSHITTSFSCKKNPVTVQTHSASA